MFLKAVQQLVLTGSVWAVLADELVQCFIQTAFDLPTKVNAFLIYSSTDYDLLLLLLVGWTSSRHQLDRFSPVTDAIQNRMRVI